MNNTKVSRLDKVLGIDPGFGRMGIAIATNKGLLLHEECFQTDKQKLFEYRLYDIYQHLKPLFKQVSTLAYEKPVIQGANGAYLNQVVAVLNILAVENKLAIVTYSPAKIKSTVTGNHKASKKEVELAVIAKCNSKVDMLDDAYDAVAICLTWNILNGNLK